MVLAVLGMSLPPAAAAEVHNEGGLKITRQHIPIRGSVYVPPPVYLPPHPILFPYYYPTSPPAEMPAYRSFYSSSDAAPLVGPYGLPLSALPWNNPGFKDYDEPPAPAMTRSLEPPQKYRLREAVVPREVPNAPANVAIILAHLPSAAPFWVDDHLTVSTGPMRYFESPPLTPGKKYVYTVRSVWFENGRWVGESVDVPVRAGQLTAVYLERVLK